MNKEQVTKRRITTGLCLFMIHCSLAIASGAGAVTPLNNALLQSDMNGGGKSITNLSVTSAYNLIAMNEITLAGRTITAFDTYPKYNVLDFGATTTAADCSAQVQATINAAITAGYFGASVVVPGVFNVSNLVAWGTIDIEGAGKGCGFRQSHKGGDPTNTWILRIMATNAAYLDWTSTYIGRMHLHDLTWDGNGRSNACTGLWLSAVEYSDFSSMDFFGINGPELYLDVGTRINTFTGDTFNFGGNMVTSASGPDWPEVYAAPESANTNLDAVNDDHFTDCTWYYAFGKEVALTGITNGSVATSPTRQMWFQNCTFNGTDNTNFAFFTQQFGYSVSQMTNWFRYYLTNEPAFVATGFDPMLTFSGCEFSVTGDAGSLNLQDCQFGIINNCKFEGKFDNVATTNFASITVGGGSGQYNLDGDIFDLPAVTNAPPTYCLPYRCTEAVVNFHAENLIYNQAIINASLGLESSASAETGFAPNLNQWYVNGAGLVVAKLNDGSFTAWLHGLTAGFRAYSAGGTEFIEGIDATNGNTTYEPVVLGGKIVQFTVSGQRAGYFDAASNFYAASGSTVTGNATNQGSTILTGALTNLTGRSSQTHNYTAVGTGGWTNLTTLNYETLNVTGSSLMAYLLAGGTVALGTFSTTTLTGRVFQPGEGFGGTGCAGYVDIAR